VQSFKVEIHPCTGTSEKDQQPAIDHFFPVYGDINPIAAGMERDRPEDPEDMMDNTFLTTVNETAQLRATYIQNGGNFRAVPKRPARDAKAVRDHINAAPDQASMFDDPYGLVHSCPHSPSFGMCASVHTDHPGRTADGLKSLEAECEELHLQPRRTRGESDGQTGIAYDISKKHSLNHSEVEHIQKMIEGEKTPGNLKGFLTRYE